MPVQVRIRKLTDGTLPRTLVPRGIAYQWILDWDKALKGALTVTAAANRPVTKQPPDRNVSERRERTIPAPIEIEAPHLAIESSQFGPWARLSTSGKIGLVMTLALVLVASAAWKWISEPSLPESGQTVSGAASGPLASLSSSLMAGPQGWLTEAASDPTGSAARRRLTLYRPSLHLSNYVVDFSGYLQSKSLGWVFRYQDASNYYATKIEITRAGVMPEIALVRWSVVDGEEIGRTRVPLPLVVRNDTLYRVRFEVRGPRFATSVLGRPVDLWSNTRLREGGFGFLNDREERAEIKSVQFSLSSAAAGR
jgi:hypothetical protein